MGVHIADVSHFVRHDSLLDLEARARSTTVYLVDRRFDMLPKLLAEDLCSLVGGQDRLAVSVVWHVDPSGPSIVGRPWFGRTVIHNRQQLSYPQVRRGTKAVRRVMVSGHVESETHTAFVGCSKQDGF